MLPFVSPKKIVSFETIAEVQTSPPAGTSQVLVPLLESIAYNVPPSQLTRTCPEFSEGVEWIGAVVLNRLALSGVDENESLGTDLPTKIDSSGKAVLNLDPLSGYTVSALTDGPFR